MSFYLIKGSVGPRPNLHAFIKSPCNDDRIIFCPEQRLLVLRPASRDLSTGRQRGRFSLNLIAVLLSLVSNLSLAMPDDREKTLHLFADSADLNQQTHRGIYTGNVKLDQGTTHLRAAKAITEGNKDNKLVLAVAEGNQKEQAHYWTQTASDKPLLHAYANTIRYLPDQHLIELIGKAQVVQGDNSFSAPKISYDTLKQHVLSKSDGKTRTMIIIHPGKKA